MGGDCFVCSGVRVGWLLFCAGGGLGGRGLFCLFRGTGGVVVVSDGVVVVVVAVFCCCCCLFVVVVLLLCVCVFFFGGGGGGGHKANTNSDHYTIISADSYFIANPDLKQHSRDGMKASPHLHNSNLLGTHQTSTFALRSQVGG